MSEDINISADESQPKRAEEQEKEMLPLQTEAIPSAEAYTVLPDLEISERQQKHVALLEQMLEEENEPSLSRRSSRSERRFSYYQYLLRLGLAIILLLAIILPVIGGIRNTSLPPTSDDIRIVQNMLDKMEEGDVVFIAFDYEAGFASEVETAAAPLLKQLSEKGVTMVVVSTLPSGTLLAQRFFERIDSPKMNKVFFAGYVPGGQVGISSMATALHRTLPKTVDGVALWNIDALRDVENLNDLGMFVVLVSDAEVARYWVEQVYQHLGDTPLVMVASEQAAPLLRPYQQMQPFPLIAGLEGGVAWEGLLQQRGTTRFFWDAYQAGLSASALILCMAVIGSIFPQTRQFKPRKRENKEA